MTLQRTEEKGEQCWPRLAASLEDFSKRWRLLISAEKERGINKSEQDKRYEQLLMLVRTIGKIG